MARRPAHFRVGLFVLVGTMILMGVAIWLGASKYFEKYHLYVTYFNESVSGLDRDSSVKYLGVEAGRVDSIRIAPDGRLVEVILKIDPRVKLEHDMRAQIETAGITGIRFIEIIRKPPMEPDRSPALNFEPPYPVIKSRPSTITTILDHLNSLYEKFMALDIQQISRQLNKVLGSIDAMAESAQAVLASGSVKRSLSNLEDASANLKEASLIMPALARRLDHLLDKDRLDRSVQDLSEAINEIREFSSQLNELKLAERVGRLDRRLERFLDTGKLNETLNTASEAASEAKKLMKKINSELGQLYIRKRIDETNRRVDEILADSRELISSLQSELLLLMETLRNATENLRQTSQTFRDLSEALSIQPSRLLFGRPPEPREFQGGQ